MIALVDLPSALAVLGGLVFTVLLVLGDAVRQERRADRGARALAEEMRGR